MFCLRAAPGEDSGVSVAELLYGAPFSARSVSIGLHWTFHTATAVPPALHGGLFRPRAIILLNKREIRIRKKYQIRIRNTDPNIPLFRTFIINVVSLNKSTYGYFA
jgi:hypothetical protein